MERNIYLCKSWVVRPSWCRMSQNHDFLLFHWIVVDNFISFEIFFRNRHLLFEKQQMVRFWKNGMFLKRKLQLCKSWVVMHNHDFLLFHRILVENFNFMEKTSFDLTKENFSFAKVELWGRHDGESHKIMISYSKTSLWKGKL